ncbi:hypothetical protein [Microbacterium sp. B24]|uniref:hypothetical protein n=1 Tax=Microbacterium sp. B24 TaxID=95616 RepID=UPI001EF9FE99|nr:hypothetical protein [Microbacterium sp. B24]
MSFRPGPLRAALALAVGFVAVRVVYRVLFHGVDGTGAVLLPLPVWPLAPPLAHVRMFGPVTADGLTAAVVGALPIALTILAFGMLSALLDLPGLLARGARRVPSRDSRGHCRSRGPHFRRSPMRHARRGGRSVCAASAASGSASACSRRCWRRPSSVPPPSARLWSCAATPVARSRATAALRSRTDLSRSGSVTTPS